ncbi:MAG: RNA polymerase sigma factor [Gammaproteobacteria bacterium]|nr:RNA polymerase sigma factor [Gammaproteobacteria bacterium]MDE2345548.1 RNA polymerase sigma factor [Gammaproteobacteria bacterium]
MPSVISFRHAQVSPAERQARFTAWVSPHLQQLHRIAWRFTGHSQDAEDLVQELLLRLYRKPGVWDKPEQPGIWLIRSLHNLYVDQWRRTRRQPLSNRHNLDWDELAGMADSGETDPERLAHSREIQRRLSAAMSTLSQEQRAILVLHDMEGHTAGELSLLLKLPLGTVKSRLFRARRQVREIFLKHGNPAAGFYVLSDELEAT